MGSLRKKLKRAFQRAMLTHVPDHPAHGGNTGDGEWDPDEKRDDSDQ
jgi:hypothetical protein